jgi:hypothetical protein
MECKVSELVKLGHERAADLRAACGTIAVAKLISDLATQLDVQLARSNALAAENAGLNAFVDALLSIAWQGGSADGAEIQELALKHGLLRQEVYSANEHETLVDDPGNFEDGDPVYFRVETPATDAFLAEVWAQGVEMFAAHKRERQQALRSRSMRMSEEAAGMAADAENFADELRKGVQS